VQEFDVGVAVTDGPRNTIRRLVAQDNLLGIALFGGSNESRIEQSRSSTNGVGIFVRDSAGTTVRRNTASTNGFVGILAFGVTQSVFAGNTVTGVDLAGDGISLDLNSTDNLVTHNSVSAAELPLSVTGDRNTVTHNRVSANRSGLIIIGNDNAATANAITDAAGCGPDGGCGIGISVEGGSHNVIAGNHVRRTFDSGMRVDAYVGSATGTEFTDNMVDRAGTDGIAIGTDHVGPVEQTVVNRNKVTRAVADGIDVDDATATLTGNTALRNGGLGIDAVIGVIDGGGNRATGNGNTGQCSANIAC
jgi:parallel beta-helix repeat protein